MKEKIEKIKRKFNKDLQDYIKSSLLDSLYLEYLGKKGIVNNLLSQIPNLLDEDKKIVGPKINELKVFIEKEINKARAVFEKQKDLEWVDFTTPGNKVKTGHYHPTTLIIRELNNFFRYYGYSVAKGPEIETDEYNFEKLNLPKDHPARDLQDSLYIKEPDILLRTHSSSVETRVMTSTKPPIRIVVPGKCYRNESTNKSNSAVFYQYEGLAIDKNINMTNPDSSYEAYIVCSNCLVHKKIEIPKGSIISQTPCPKCGNLTLEVDPNGEISDRPQKPYFKSQRFF